MYVLLWAYLTASLTGRWQSILLQLVSRHLPENDKSLRCKNWWPTHLKQLKTLLPSQQCIFAIETSWDNGRLENTGCWRKHKLNKNKPTQKKTCFDSIPEKKKNLTKKKNPWLRLVSSAKRRAFFRLYSGKEDSWLSELLTILSPKRN